MTSLRARAQAILDAAEKMTPGPWSSKGYGFSAGLAHPPAASGQLGWADGFQDDCTKQQRDEGPTNAAGIVALRNDAPAVIRDLVDALDAPPGEPVACPTPSEPKERVPCSAWSEPLTAAGEAYYCTATFGMFTLEVARAGVDGHLMKHWAWTVYGPARSLMARSERRTTLVDAHLACEDRALALLDEARARLVGRRP